MAKLYAVALQEQGDFEPIHWIEFRHANDESEARDIVIDANPRAQVLAVQEDPYYRGS